jgi:hypothetical protein
MPKKNPSTLFAERLRTLLADRKMLRRLFARYEMFVNLRSFTDGRIDLEQKIAAIISAGLSFSEKERLCQLPHACHLAEGAFRMRNVFNRTDLLENPALIWNGSPIPGILTTNWHPAVKQRLLDLVGPLDDILERMLSA